MAQVNPLPLFRLALLDREVFEILSQKKHLASIAAFHAQQAIEKAFKAVLDSKDIAYPKTHNLLTLLDLLRQANLACDADERVLVLLVRYAVEGRYDENSLSQVRVEPIHQTVKLVFEWSSSIISLDNKENL